MSRFDRSRRRARADPEWSDAADTGLAGIYPGMPAAAARAQLQKRSSTLNVLTMGNPPDYFLLTIPDPMISESISVYVTAEPNDPAVWLIQRSQDFTDRIPCRRRR